MEGGQMAPRSDSKIDQVMTEKLRMEFVEGYTNDGVRVFPTIDELIKKHDLPVKTAYNRSKEGRWQEQRNSFKSQYDAQRNAQRAKRKADKADKFDDTALTLAENIFARVGRKLTLAAQQDRVTGGDSLTTPELKDIAETVIKAQKAGKLALGEAAEIKQVVSDDVVPASLSRIIDQLDQLAEKKSQGASHTIQ
tara:strand:+ start:1514 stop:2095 length:582 start_codon:yes stop_codon:yes gene_type:complete